MVKKPAEDLTEIQKAIYAKRLDQMEKKFSITSQELNIPAKLSSGYLCIDLITGGGIASGKMYTFSGQEKASKSTCIFHIEGQAVRKEVPIIAHYDAEGATSDPDYVKACTGFTTRELYYGNKKPIRLYQESKLELFYNLTKSIMRSLPDKIYRQDNKQWFHVFDDTKEDRQNMAEFGYKSYNKIFFQENGRLWCETDKAGMQGLIICDSYAALLVSKLDEDDNAKQLPAMTARAFADNLKKVVGGLSNKGFSILGTNQIRINPMPSYGQSSEYESSGTALAFYSSVRCQNRPRSVPSEMFPGISSSGNKTTSFGQEFSVYGKGLDRYHYIGITNTKNRLGTPGLFAMLRVWFRDGLGNAHGYDIAYDVFNYLNMTGRIEGSPRKGMKLLLPEFKDIPKLTWDEFKLIILAHTDPVLMKRAREYFKSIKTIPNIRPNLFKEIRTKEAYKLLVEKSPNSKEDLEG